MSQENVRTPAKLRSSRASLPDRFLWKQTLKIVWKFGRYWAQEINQPFPLRNLLWVYAYISQYLPRFGAAWNWTALCDNICFQSMSLIFSFVFFCAVLPQHHRQPHWVLEFSQLRVMAWNVCLLAQLPWGRAINCEYNFHGNPCQVFFNTFTAYEIAQLCWRWLIMLGLASLVCSRNKALFITTSGLHLLVLLQVLSSKPKAT